MAAADRKGFFNRIPSSRAGLATGWLLSGWMRRGLRTLLASLVPQFMLESLTHWRRITEPQEDSGKTHLVPAFKELPGQRPCSCLGATLSRRSLGP